MLIDARYLKNKILLTRIRNLGQYWNFNSNIWTDTESVDTKIQLQEYSDSSLVESYYAINLNTPPGGPWPIEILEMESGSVLFRGDTDVPVVSRMEAFSYIAPDNSAIQDIKTKTDILPADILLATDSRLNHLDADISTRSTFDGGQVSSVLNPVTVGINNDKTGYSSTAVLPDDQLELLVQTKTQAELARKLQSNKAVISEDGSTVTVYDDDQETILYRFGVSLDQRTRVPL